MGQIARSAVWCDLRRQMDSVRGTLWAFVAYLGQHVGPLMAFGGLVSILANLGKAIDTIQKAVSSAMAFFESVKSIAKAVYEPIKAITEFLKTLQDFWGFVKRLLGWIFGGSPPPLPSTPPPPNKKERVYHRVDAAGRHVVFRVIDGGKTKLILLAKVLIKVLSGRASSETRTDGLAEFTDLNAQWSAKIARIKAALRDDMAFGPAISSGTRLSGFGDEDHMARIASDGDCQVGMLSYRRIEAGIGIALALGWAAILGSDGGTIVLGSLLSFRATGQIVTAAAAIKLIFVRGTNAVGWQCAGLERWIGEWMCGRWGASIAAI